MSKEVQELRQRKRENAVAERKKQRLSLDDDLIRKATGSKTHRLWLRSVVILSSIILVYFFSKDRKEVKFGLRKEHIILRSQKVQCSEQFVAATEAFPKCAPESCGRFVTDTLVEAKEAAILRRVAGKEYDARGVDGFVDLLSCSSTETDFLVTFKLVVSKIRRALSERFAIDENRVHLASPTFFTKETNETESSSEKPPVVGYTATLFLSDYDSDFKAGRFLFVDGSEDHKNQTATVVEQKSGRLVVFTSGGMNLYENEKIVSGERYAMTMSFTCDPKFAVAEMSFGIE